MAVLSVHFFSTGQKNVSNLEPIRGHYKQLSLLSAVPAPANDSIDKQTFLYNAASAEKKLSLKPIYLRNVSVTDFKISPPPVNSSKQTRAELNYLLHLQQQRTEEEIHASLYLANVYYNLRVKPEDSTYHQYRKNLFHIGRSVGTWFNPNDLPVTADFMAKVWQDASYFIWSLKYKYLRVRPNVLDADIHNLEETDWAAYPSGHAANSYVNAYIYQELAPEFSDIFLKDAYDMAHSREILGVHFPSDSEASRIFARQFVNLLFQQENFKSDFQKVKEEWRVKSTGNFDKPIITPGHPSGKSSCAKVCKD